MPGPGIPIATASPSAFSGMGSAFLTGAGQAAGSLLGSFGGQSSKSKRRDQRKAYEYQAKYLPMIQSAQFKQHMKDIDEAGLHRLAGLGISPASGGQAMGAINPNIPGQSPTGSAIESGINTAINVQRANTQQAHSKVMANLQLEEQSLRNDWLRTQIQASKLKTAGAISNSQQDVIHIPQSGPLSRGTSGFNVTVGEPPEVTPKNSGIVLPGGQTIPMTSNRTTAEGISDQYGDVVEWVYGAARAIEDIYGAVAPSVKKYMHKEIMDSFERGKKRRNARAVRKYDSRTSMQLGHAPR